MNTEDKYRRLRTDMEDMIESHQELVRIWKSVTLRYDQLNLPLPSVHLEVIVEQLLPKEQNAKLLNSTSELHSALIMAKNWMDCDNDNRDSMTEHDRAVYDDIMDSINKALTKATNP